MHQTALYALETLRECIEDDKNMDVTVRRHTEMAIHHLELAAATDAVISYGDVAPPDFSMEPLADGQRLSLGEVELEIRHTPGHTPESISIVVYEHPGAKPWGVLTGDTLFNCSPDCATLFS